MVIFGFVCKLDIYIYLYGYVCIYECVCVWLELLVLVNGDSSVNGVGD